MASWKSTALGIIGGIGILATQLTALLDSDPATVFDISVAIGALGVFGLGVVARDNGVSSEDVGAK